MDASFFGRRETKRESTVDNKSSRTKLKINTELKANYLGSYLKISEVIERKSNGETFARHPKVNVRMLHVEQGNRRLSMHFFLATQRSS